MTGLLLRDCRVGRRRADVRVRGDRVVEVGSALDRDGEREICGRGGSLLPGLHDHHIHLLALAAELTSVRCGPDTTPTREVFVARLRAAARSGEVRATGYHESVAGDLDRDRLDAVAADRPVRVQHRSGAAWFLNTAALREFDLESSPDPAVERDAHGRATGRLLRGDHLLHRADRAMPDLAPVGRLLAERGVVGVTDATPDLDDRRLDALRAAAASGAIPQRLALLGTPLEDAESRGVPRKIMLDESYGLDVVRLTAAVTTSHLAGRPVAVHCVTRAETVAAVTAIAEAGPLDGDRIEHGSVVPGELDARIAGLRLTVVTQPNFISERGDDYLRDVDPRDRDALYRCRSLLAAGVRVAAGTDAPHGCADPWRAVAAAATRRTRAGSVLGETETLSPSRALRLFLGPALRPGGEPRRVAVGARADLCLLRGSLDDALVEPAADHVALTLVGGRVVHPT